jgi:hypothetical protein
MNSPGGRIQLLLNNSVFSSESSLENLFAQEFIQPLLKSLISGDAREAHLQFVGPVGELVVLMTFEQRYPNPAWLAS